MKTHIAWALASGAFIPVMAILNARFGRALGEPLHATVVLLCVGLLAAVAFSLIFAKSLPGPGKLGSAQPLEYLGGLVVAFYVVSATLLAPRMGSARSCGTRRSSTTRSPCPCRAPVVRAS